MHVRLLLTVSGTGDRVIETGSSATVAELVAVLEPGQAPGSVRSLQVQRNAAVLAPESPLGAVDLRSGDRVTLIDIEPDTPLDRGPDPSVEPSAALVMLTGPLAGEVFQLPAGTTSVGRAATNDLVLADPGISRRHATISVDPAAVVVTDRGSTNRVQVEGVPIDGPTAVRSGQRMLLGQSWAIVDHHRVPQMPIGGCIPFERPPRLLRPYRGRIFTVSAPEDEPEPRRGLRSRLAGRPPGPSDAALDRLLAELNLARRAEREARLAETPSIDDVVLGVRSRTRLWERRLTDADVLEVRLGLAELPSRHRVEVEPGGPPGFRRRVDRLPDTYGVIDGVPATFDLGRPGGLTVRGPLAEARAMARAVVGQLVGLNPPDQLGLIVCGDEEALEAWDWLKWVPHLLGADGDRPPVGPEAVVAVERLLDADPRAESAGAPLDSRPPFVVVVVDGSDPSSNGSGPELVRRLLADGSPRGVHPLIVERTPDEPADGEQAAAGAILTVGDPTGRLTTPAGPVEVVDPVALEPLGPGAAAELARLLAPLVLGRPSPPGDDAALPTARPLMLDPAKASGPGPEPRLDLFDLPSVDGDDRLVLGRARVSDDLETVLAFNPARDGTLGLIGPDGDDRAGCLLTIGTAVARADGPDDERPGLYGFGAAGSLNGLRPLPVVAGVVDDDPDQAIELLATIEQLMGDRLLTFELAGVDDLAAYRRARPEVPLRRWMVLIDGLGRLAAQLDSAHPGRTREVVGQLLEIGSSLGLHLVFTAAERHEVDPLLVPKVGRWLEMEDGPGSAGSGRLRLDGVRVRFAAPGGSWDRADIERAIAGLVGADVEPGLALDADDEPSTGSGESEPGEPVTIGAPADGD